MQRLRRLTKRFWELPAGERRTLCEAALRLTIFRLLLPVMPVRLLAAIGRAGGAAADRAPALSKAQIEQIHLISRALGRGARGLPWHSSCLVLALSGERMLHRRRLPARLEFGVATSDEGFGAHASLSSDGIAVCGTAEMRRFAPIASFERKAAVS